VSFSTCSKTSRRIVFRNFTKKNIENYSLTILLVPQYECLTGLFSSGPARSRNEATSRTVRLRNQICCFLMFFRSTSPGKSLHMISPNRTNLAPITKVRGLGFSHIYISHIYSFSFTDFSLVYHSVFAQIFPRL
jgi:hypothetical protein